MRSLSVLSMIVCLSSMQLLTSNVDRDALTACCALVLLEPARMAMEFLVLPRRLSERKTFGCKNTVGGYRRPPDPR